MVEIVAGYGGRGTRGKARSAIKPLDAEAVKSLVGEDSHSVLRG